MPNDSWCQLYMFWDYIFTSCAMQVSEQQFLKWRDTRFFPVPYRVDQSVGSYFEVGLLFLSRFTLCGNLSLTELCICRDLSSNNLSGHLPRFQSNNNNMAKGCIYIVKKFILG